jgi:hypothetical protein
MEQRRGESNLDFFDRYVMNGIPIRLIRLSDMKLVGRNDVRKHLRSSVPLYESHCHPSDIVKYAILSHRWLHEGEPTYEEMKSGIILEAGPGYKKLKKFCEKAQAYDVEFAWSDTCCIDKSSSIELDESIRSMFRWYRNSHICIVHLAQSETIEGISDDEWTRRGWTLQELLAPRNIKLFNKRWIPITGVANDKEEFWPKNRVMMTLEKATYIPLGALCHFQPGPNKVDERMMWAARRKTTRDEDVAYSLMGVFDVSLQIAYGEGGDRAFCRLIEAIMQAGDSSVHNWSGVPARHHSSGAIPRSPQSFVGQTLDSRSGLFPEPLEMTMTSLGLRLPLVIFPLTVTSFTKEFLGPSRFAAACQLCPTIKVNFVAWSVDPRFGTPGPQFSLGIVNYSLESGLYLRIPGKSACFILQRQSTCISSSKSVCQPRHGDFVGLKTVSPPEYKYSPWKKAYWQGLVEVNFPNIPSDSYIYISREYLDIVYL